MIPNFSILAQIYPKFLARYSASLWGSTFNKLIAAVGTVFNEVLLWNPFSCMQSRDILNTTSVVKLQVHPRRRLKGHEVSNFNPLSVHINKAHANILIIWFP